MTRLFPCLVAALVLTGCGDTPYKRIARGYRAVRASARLAQEFDAAIKNALAAKHAECKAKHGAKTPAFDQCVLPMLRVSRAWTGEKAGQPTGKGVLPTLQAAQKATKLALDAAFDYVVDHEKQCGGDNAPKECHGDWQAGLKPALCAAWTVVEAGIKLGAYKATSDPTFKTVQALVTAFACQ